MATIPHVKLTMSGTFDNGSGGAAVEIFSMSLAFAAVTGAQLSQAQLQATIADVTTGCEAWFADPLTGISVNTTLTQVKIAQIGTNGKYVGDAVFEVVARNGGVNENGPYPSEVSYAVSLRTAVRGPKGRGRFYVPGPTLAATSGWRIDPTAAQGAANSAYHALISLDNGTIGKAFVTHSPDPADIFGVVVASKVAGNTPVETVQVGDVFDTIRRRRNKLRENYHTGVDES